MSECKHEMIWAGSYTNLRCAKCNESYAAIQIGKIAQLESELSECRAENESLKMQAGELASEIEMKDKQLEALRKAAVEPGRAG